MARVLIFDSGVGGLSVAAQIRKLLPSLSQIYAADDAFRPYGEKSDTQLNARLPSLLSILTDITRSDLVIIACNTASTTALPFIRAVLEVPVVGVVPAIKPAAAQSESGVIGVLGTPATIRRKYVDRLITEYAADKKVILQGSTMLVHLAEQKLEGRRVDLSQIKDEILPLFSGPDGKNVDQIVLACTHFPLLVPELRRAAPHAVNWVDSGAAIARRVQTLLSQNKRADKATDNIKGDVALLIGPQASELRQRAFAGFGFNRTIGLEPDFKG